MKVAEHERGKYSKVKMAYTAVPCMQCDKPTCAEAAQNGAVYQREDGIVIIEPASATGQKEILGSCPYGVIYWQRRKAATAEVYFLRTSAGRGMERTKMC